MIVKLAANEKFLSPSRKKVNGALVSVLCVGTIVCLYAKVAADGD